MEINDIHKDVQEYVQTQQSKKYQRSKIIVIVCAVIVVSIFVFTILREGTTSETFIFAFIMSIPVILVGVFMSPANLYERTVIDLKHVFMEQIAEKMHCSYNKTGEVGALHGVFFKLGHNNKLEDVIAGTYNDKTLQIATYTATYGYGKNSTTEPYTVFTYFLKSSAAKIILFRRVNTGFIDDNEISNKEKIPDDTEPVTLEGDFNKYFMLFMERGYEVEVREIFQPDYMLTTLKEFGMQRLETNDDQFHFICPFFSNREELFKCLEQTEKIFDYMTPYLIKD